MRAARIRAQHIAPEKIAGRDNPRIWLLTIVAAILWCILSVQRAAGDDRVVQFPGMSDPAVEFWSQVEQPPFTGGHAEGTPGAPYQPDFWIVSSRHCDSKHDEHCNCPMAYLHRDPGGRMCQRDFASFQQWLQPGVPVCIVVHGSFSTWEDVVRDSHGMYRWMRGAAPHLPLQIVFFTWPNEGPTHVYPVDVAILGRRGARHGHYLARLICQIPPGHPISMFGHSHGTRVVSSSMHLLAGGTVQDTRFLGRDPGNPIRIALSAAAIDHDWLTPGDKYGRALCRVDRLLLLRNREDFVLKLYPARKLFSGAALSRKGFTRKDRRRLGSLGAKIWELDVSHIIRHHHFWHNYYRHPSIARAMVPTMYYTDFVRYDWPADESPHRSPEEVSDLSGRGISPPDPDAIPTSTSGDRPSYGEPIRQSLAEPRWSATAVR